MIVVNPNAKLEWSGKIWPTLRTWEVCRAFDNRPMQEWLNENPEQREKYLDWYEAKYIKANAGAGGTA